MSCAPTAALCAILLWIQSLVGAIPAHPTRAQEIVQWSELLWLTPAFLALAHPERVRSAILGGLGYHLVEGVGLTEAIAQALEAPARADIADPTALMFRTFAEQTKSDLRALAACMRGSRQTISREEVARIAAPTLIGVGTKDSVAGSAQELAALMPNAVALDIPGRDHMLAVGDKVFKAGVLAFLEDNP